MIILGIETSCDETSAAIIETQDKALVLKSNIISSSLHLHAQTGGIIPEIAARQQLKVMIPVIDNALHTANISLTDIDAIALTYGPGLIGSLLVGVETAKTLAFVLKKPIIPVNHMIGHIYANWIEHPEIEFPVLALVVSGGHTDLLFMKQHGDFQLLGGTRDDAAGEAFDKIGRLLGLAYPAGPDIEKLAQEGDPKRFHFPRPLIGSDDYDFSFSGLKTAVFREVSKQNTKPDSQTVADLARATQEAIIDVIVKKTLKAAVKNQVKSIVISGGVAANQALLARIKLDAKRASLDAQIFVPKKDLCTDNAAMIATAAFYNYKPVQWNTINPDPQLYFE